MIIKTLNIHIQKIIVYLYCNLPIVKGWKSKNNPCNISKSMLGLDDQYSPAWVTKANVGLGTVPERKTN